MGDLGVKEAIESSFLGSGEEGGDYGEGWGGEGRAGLFLFLAAHRWQVMSANFLAFIFWPSFPFIFPDYNMRELAWIFPKALPALCFSDLSRSVLFPSLPRALSVPGRGRLHCGCWYVLI